MGRSAVTPQLVPICFKITRTHRSEISNLIHLNGIFHVVPQVMKPQQWFLKEFLKEAILCSRGLTAVSFENLSVLITCIKRQLIQNHDRKGPHKLDDRTTKQKIRDQLFNQIFSYSSHSTARGTNKKKGPSLTPKTFKMTIHHQMKSKLQ